MKCADCRFWEAPREGEWDAVRKVMGRCNRTPHVEDATTWGDEDDDFERVMLPEYADRTAATWDASGYSSGLICKPEHFCAMFASKETPQ